MIINLPTMRNYVTGEQQHFIRVLPTRWRRKSAGIDMERNYITVILRISHEHQLNSAKLYGADSSGTNGLASTSIRNAELSLNSFRRELKTLYCRRAYQRDRASLRQSAAIRARRHQISFPNCNGLNSSRPRFAPA